MRNIRYLVFFLFLACNSQIIAQTQLISLFNIGIIHPIGKLSDFHKTGYELGTKILIPSKLINHLALGILYSNYPGKEYNTSNELGESFGEGFQTTNTNQTESYESSSILKFFIGPQINAQSIYFLPNLSGNFSGGSFRIGFDFNIGYSSQLNKKYFIDIYGRYEFQNIIGKNEGESTISALHAGIGFGF